MWCVDAEPGRERSNKYRHGGTKASIANNPAKKGVRPSIRRYVTILLREVPSRSQSRKESALSNELQIASRRGRKTLNVVARSCATWTVLPPSIDGDTYPRELCCLPCACQIRSNLCFPIFFHRQASPTASRTLTFNSPHFSSVARSHLAENDVIVSSHHPSQIYQLAPKAAPERTLLSVRFGRHGHPAWRRGRHNTIRTHAIATYTIGTTRI
jgi:hypothetical protein